AWNQAIKDSYNSQSDALKSRFFNLDPTTLPNPITARVQWFADPAEPTFCLDETWGQKLSDWDIRGRHNLHNEYCEYTIQYAMDSNGRRRPKRVHFSTELREYWVTIAKHDPNKLKEMATKVLGFEPSFQDLYGTADPNSLSEDMREVRFSTLVAGHGNDPNLPSNVPAQPTSPLNREHMLFMTHPINGLDDLLYIVMFGAHPYTNIVNGQRFPASKEQIFRQFGVEHLACRHADPAAAIGAHAAAYGGRALAFADPLGMYIRTFNGSDILYQGNPVPADWVRFRRGSGTGLYQRLEIGAPDSEDVFLDDLAIVTGSSVSAIIGGYQIARKIEVGPLVLASEETNVADDEYRVLTASDNLIACASVEVCSRTIQPLKVAYENEHGPSPLARPRII
ncbi:MAG: hypothetical protein H0W34_05785, partial [Pyrinomonadaceae bacterium]|nr:hypothetical protein [Pyrinomonadaceae bacterium]